MAYRSWLLSLWKSRAHAAYVRYEILGRPDAALLCIHSKEGSWTDPNAPYWGGFQADLSFMQTYNARAYARYGTANNWPIADQVIMARRGRASRGYSPWPVTSIECGL